MVLYIGRDVNNGTGTTPASNYYARLAINTTNTSGEFQVRDYDNRTDGNNYSGTQTVTWVLNNSGSTMNYAAPNSTTQNLANDKADVWVGTNLEFDNISVNEPTQTLARFKFLADSWANNTTFTLDNISISSVQNLPVELNSFSANMENKDVELKWTTATEKNNYGFEVQRNNSKFTIKNK